MNNNLTINNFYVIKGSRICTFSPCIEQVQKTCTSLRDHQFVDIETVECILKPFEVKPSQLLIYDFSKAKNQVWIFGNVTISLEKLIY